MATSLRLLWSIAVSLLVAYFVPGPWWWIWISVIWGMWALFVLLAVYQLGIRNCWPLRRS